MFSAKSCFALLLFSSTAAAVLPPPHDLPVLWEQVPGQELRSFRPTSIELDAAGWFTWSPGPPMRRIAIDPASGAVADRGPKGIPLPVNTGSAEFDYGYGTNLCFGACIVGQRVLRRFAADGSLSWSFPLAGGGGQGDDLGAGALSEWPGLVVVTHNFSVLALDQASGALRWHYDATPCRLEKLDVGRWWRRCGHDGQAVIALDVQGRELWRVDLVAPVLAVVGQPSGNTEIVEEQGLDLRWRVLDATVQSQGSVLLPQPGPLTGPVQLIGNSAGDSVLSARTAAGTRIYALSAGLDQPRWIHTTAPALANPALLGVDSAGQVLLAGNSGDHSVVVALAAADGQPRWQHALEAGEFAGGTARSLPGKELLLRSRLNQPFSYFWYGIDLTSGQRLWRRQQVELPVIRENTGFVDGDKFVSLELQASNPQHPTILVHERDLDGTLLHSAELPLPALLAPLSVRLEQAHNSDRVVLYVSESPDGQAGGLMTQLVIDRRRWRVLEAQALSEPVAPAGDRGYLKLAQCEGNGACRLLRWYGGDAAVPDWQLQLPLGHLGQWVYSDGALLQLSGYPGHLRFVHPDGSVRFERALQVSQFQPVLRTAEGHFVVAIGSMLALLDGDTGETRAQVSLDGVGSLRYFGLAQGLVQVIGASELQLGLDPQTLGLRLRLEGPQLSLARLSAPLRSGNAASFSREVRDFFFLGYPIEQLELALAPVSVVSRRTVAFRSLRLEKGPNVQALTLRPGLMVLGQTSIRDYYGAVTRFQGLHLSPPVRRAALSLQLVQGPGPDRMEIVIRNQGPDHTEAVLRIRASSDSGFLQRLECSASAGAESACVWPGIDLPSTLALPPGAELRFQVRQRSTHGNEGEEYALSLHADASTNEIDRSDNLGYVQLIAPLFASGFE